MTKYYTEEELLLLSRQDNIQRHRLRGAEVQKSIGHLFFLDTCSKSAGVACTCGRRGAHKTIQFKEDDAVIEEMCPIDWYRKLGRISFERGESISRFMEVLPLDLFMRAYKA